MDSTSLASLYLDKESSDLDLHIRGTGRKVVLPAHKFVLRRASEVFRAMLEKDKFKEGSSREIEIEVNGDITIGLLFLKYLYTKDLEYYDVNTYVTLFQPAHLYQVTRLVELCERRIVYYLTPLTVCETYVALEGKASENSLNQCKELMLQSAFWIFANNLHFILSKEIMSFLLSSEKLNVLNEEQTLGALWKWGTHRISLESPGDDRYVGYKPFISDLLPLIRLSLITSVSETTAWFSLWEDLKSENGITEDILRTPEAIPPVSRFACVLNISCHTETSDKKEEVQAKFHQDLLDFTVDCDILLAGVIFHVTALDEIEPSVCPFRTLINYKDYTNLISLKPFLLSKWHGKETHKYYINNKVVRNINKVHYVYEMRMDFLTPVLLRSTALNQVTLEVSTLVHFQKYTLVMPFYKISVSGTTFTLCGPTHGVRQLLYFIK